MAADRMSDGKSEIFIKVVSSTVLDEDNFLCEVRSNISDEESFSAWLKCFSETTKTNWILRSSISGENSLYDFSRNYVCQHSSFKKNSKKDVAVQKNKNCQASLKIRIKRNTKYTRCRDPYVKEGLCAILSIKFQHSHHLNVAEGWGWLKRKDETRLTFIEYFNNGLSPADAIYYHEDALLLDGAENLDDASINPPKHWVYYLHNIWRKHKYSGASKVESFYNMSSCCVIGCTNRPSKKMPGITFHRFPKDSDRSSAWIKAVGREDWKPTVYTRICSLHFCEEAIDRTSLCVVRLREHAVPSIFEAFPSHKKKKSLSVYKQSDPHLGPVVVIKEEPIDIDEEDVYNRASSSGTSLKKHEFGLPYDVWPSISGNEPSPTPLVGVAFSVSNSKKDSDQGLESARSVPEKTSTAKGRSRSKKPKNDDFKKVPSTSRSKKSQKYDDDLEKVPSENNTDDFSVADSRPSDRPKDQFDVYGESIAAKLRKLDWRSCAYVQKAIGDIILEAEMGKYSQELSVPVSATPAQ